MKASLLFLALLLLAPLAPAGARPLVAAACDTGNDAPRQQDPDRGKGDVADVCHGAHASGGKAHEHREASDPNRRFWREKRRKVFEPESFDAP
jgi:hypothetical protein